MHIWMAFFYVLLMGMSDGLDWIGANFLYTTILRLNCESKNVKCQNDFENSYFVLNIVLD